MSLRPIILAVVGHVDSGKTTFLDNYRNSSVGKHEIGGITQKIGVTYLDKDHLQRYVDELGIELKLSGNLFVDTPGHDCFSSSRLIATEICDLSIVIMDIFKGVEKRTEEVLKHLIEKKKPFVIFLNKLDKIDGWINYDNKSFVSNLKKQTTIVQKEVKKYVNQSIAQLAMLEKNAALFGQNPDEKEYITIVLGSAVNGLGFPEITCTIDHFGYDYMNKKLKEKDDLTRGFILETKKDDKYGHGASVILTDGIIKLNDNVLVKTYDGIRSVQIKNIFVPTNGKEMKDKMIFDSVEEQESGRGLFLRFDDSTGIQPAHHFYIYHDNSEKEELTKKLQKEIDKDNEKIDDFEFKFPGIIINASSYLTADAVKYEFVKKNVPISYISIGPLTKKDIMKSIPNHKLIDMDEKIDNSRYSVLIVYGNYISDELREYAKENKVCLISDDIIYRLIEKYDILFERVKSLFIKRYPNILTPVKASIFPQHVYTKRNPLVLGVKILFGTLKSGTLICAKKGNNKILLGKLTSIQKDNKELEEGKKNQEVCLKIETLKDKKKYVYDEDFDYTWTLETMLTIKEEAILSKYSEYFDIKKDEKIDDKTYSK